MNNGKLRKRWSEHRPAEYDKATGVARFGIEPVTRNTNDGKEAPGFSYYEVQVNGSSNYGSIKSQLIESGFNAKDEVALLMNAVSAILTEAAAATNWTAFKNALVSNEDIAKFNGFQEFREVCSQVAHKIVGK